MTYKGVLHLCQRDVFGARVLTHLRAGACVYTGYVMLQSVWRLTGHFQGEFSRIVCGLGVGSRYELQLSTECSLIGSRYLLSFVHFPPSSHTLSETASQTASAQWSAPVRVCLWKVQTETPGK